MLARLLPDARVGPRGWPPSIMTAPRLCTTTKTTMGEPSVRHWLHNLRKSPGCRKPHRRRPPTLEVLEARDVPSMATPGIAYSPATVRKAYGFDQVRFGGLLGDGSGQTVAIVDCYDNPRFVSSGSPGFAG